jgi:hypothetical protein
VDQVLREDVVEQRIDLLATVLNEERPPVLQRLLNVRPESAVLEIHLCACPFKARSCR